MGCGLLGRLSECHGSGRRPRWTMSWVEMLWGLGYRMYRECLDCSWCLGSCLEGLEQEGNCRVACFLFHFGFPGLDFHEDLLVLGGVLGAHIWFHFLHKYIGDHLFTAMHHLQGYTIETFAKATTVQGHFPISLPNRDVRSIRFDASDPKYYQSHHSYARSILTGD